MFRRSTRKNKKYMVYYKKKWIHFGDRRFKQYRDSTGLNLYSHMDHNDKDRRNRYLARAKAIKNKYGELTYKDKTSPNYYAVRYLW